MTAQPFLPALAVVVPVRNGAAHLGELLDSLVAQHTDLPWELVVVDNDSSDGSGDLAIEHLARASGPSPLRSAVIVHRETIGFASPRNAGVRSTTAPLLAFCDADDAVEPEWLDRMARALTTAPLVASEVLGMGEDVVLDGPPRAFGLEVAHCCGLGCTRDLFDRLGGFDHHFDRGGEDVDFSLRARSAEGVVPIVARGARYRVRRRGAAWASFQQARRNGRSQVLLFERHHGSLRLAPSPWTLLLHRVTDLVRWSPRVFRPSMRAGYLSAVGMFVGRTYWSARRRQRWF